MPISREQARRELARRELARRELARREADQSTREEGTAFKGYDTTAQDLEDIYTKHGITDETQKKTIRDLAPFYAPETWKSENTQDSMRWIAGKVGEAALLGIPQYIQKKMIDDKSTREALDSIRAMNNSRRSYAAAATDLLGPSVGAKLAKGAGLAAKSALGVGTGTAAGVAQSREGEEAEGAVIGGTIGGVVGAGLGLLTTSTKKGAEIASRKREELAESLAEDTDLKNRATRMGKITREEVNEFAELRGISSRDAVKYVKDLKKTATDPSSVDRAFLDMRVNKLRGEKLKHSGVDERDVTWMTNILDFVTDGKFRTRMLDTKYGTGGEKILDDMSNAYNKFTVKVQDVANVRQKLVQGMAKSKLKSEDLIDILEGRAKPKSQAQAKVAQAWKETFEKLRGQAEEMGVRIDKRENYVPRYVVSTPEYVVKVQDKIGQASKLLNKNATQFNSEDLTRLSEEMPELFDALAVQSGRNIRKAKGGLVKMWHKQLNDLTDLDRVGSRIGTVAKSALERGEIGVPDFIRQKDVAKLLEGWTHSTFRHAHLREGLDKLAGLEKQYKSAGLSDAESYISNLRKDLTGVTRDAGGLVGKARRSVDRWRLRKEIELEQKVLELEKQGKKHEARTLKAKKTASQLVTGLLNTNNLYPYYLGLRPDAALRNLTQPITMSIPEFNNLGSYGVSKAAKAYVKSISQAKDMLWTPEKLRAEGLLPGKWTEEAQDELFNALEAGFGKGGTGKKVTRAMHDAAMYMYTRSDVINRTVTKNMAEDIARDFAKKNKSATTFVENMPLAYRKAIAQSSNNREVDKLITQYLLSTTQFNYNRISMSEYGRTLGGLFSMFSKWPTTILGDVRSTLQRGKTGDLPLHIATNKTFQRYIAPSLAISAFNSMLDDGEDLPPAVKKLVPTQNWTPASSLKTFLKPSDFATPPAFDIIGEATGTLVKAANRVGTDEDVVGSINWKRLTDKGAAFLPLSIYGKSLYRLDDLFNEGELLPFNEDN